MFKIEVYTPRPGAIAVEGSGVDGDPPNNEEVALYLSVLSLITGAIEAGAIKAEFDAASVFTSVSTLISAMHKESETKSCRECSNFEACAALIDAASKAILSIHDAVEEAFFSMGHSDGGIPDEFKDFLGTLFERDDD